MWESKQLTFCTLKKKPKYSHTSFPAKKPHLICIVHVEDPLLEHLVVVLREAVLHDAAKVLSRDAALRMLGDEVVERGLQLLPTWGLTGKKYHIKFK